MALLNIGTFKFASTGETRLREIVYTSTACYWALVTSAKTPSQADNVYSTISSFLCATGGYAHQVVGGKAILSTGAIDANDPDFGTGMVGKFVYLLTGTAGSPGANDRIIGHYNLDTTVSTNVTVNGAIILDPLGIARFAIATW